MSTIIIESNRQLAYKSIRDSNNETTINDIQLYDDTSERANRWRTSLAEGQAIEVGDEISIEACMVNSIGGGDDVMEFLGRTGETFKNLGIKDNKLQFDFNFYISNNHQFSFPLPKSSCLIDTETYNFNYGGPLWDVIGFPVGATSNKLGYAVWNQNYPMDAIEGSKHDNTAPPNRIFTPITRPKPTTFPDFFPNIPLPTSINNLFQGSFVKGSYANQQPNNTRLYIGQPEWDGPYFCVDLSITETQNDGWTKFVSSNIVDVPTGFSTPTSIAERLTSQLHRRFGNADDWNNTTINNIFPSIFKIDTSGNIGFATMPGITDSTYQIFPTTSGDGFYRRTRSAGQPNLITGWDSSFVGERDPPTSTGTLMARGSNYRTKQGRRMFYSNMLCGNSREWEGFTYFNLRVQSRSFINIPENRNEILYSGTIKQSQFPRPEDPSQSITIGQLGCNCCILNVEQKTALTPMIIANSKVTLITDFSTPSSVPPTPDEENKRRLEVNIPMWNIRDRDVVAVNLIFTSLTVSIIRETYARINYLEKPIDVNSTDFNPLSREFLDINKSDWTLGRLDDQNTNFDANRQIYLPNANMMYQSGLIDATNPTQYYNDNVAQNGTIIASELSYGSDITQELYVNRNQFRQVPRMVGGDRYSNTRQHIRGYTYMDNNLFNAESAQNNYAGTNFARNINAPESLFTTSIPNNNTNFLNSLYKLVEAETGNLKNQGVGIIPLFYKPSIGYDHLLNIPFVGIIVMKGPDQPIFPYPLIGEFFGPGSPSMTQNNLAKIVTTQKIDVNGYPQWLGTDDSTGIQPQDYMPYMYAGSSDALIDFGDQGRFAISDFHTPLTEGNGPWQNVQPIRSEQPLLPILRCLGRQSYLSFIDGKDELNAYNVQEQIDFRQPMASVQSGIAIQSIQGFYDIPNVQSFLFENTRNNLYIGTLLDKMGFLLEQIIPQYGLENNEFNRGNYNQYLGYRNNRWLKQQNMVYPFTTNAYISSAEMLSLTKCIATDSTANTQIIPGPRPSGNLGGIIAISSQTQATSDQLIGFRMPSKLDYPYLVVYSDIVRNPTYYGGSDSQKLPAIAYLTRNYAEGDYFYSFATTWTHIVDINYVLTDITTDIRLPDGSPAPIDRNSSVIYKITKRPILPPPLDPKTGKQITPK